MTFTHSQIKAHSAYGPSIQVVSAAGLYSTGVAIFDVIHSYYVLGVANFLEWVDFVVFLPCEQSEAPNRF